MLVVSGKMRLSKFLGRFSPGILAEPRSALPGGLQAGVSSARAGTEKSPPLTGRASMAQKQIEIGIVLSF